MRNLRTAHILVVLCFIGAGRHVLAQDVVIDTDKALALLKDGNSRFVADRPVSKDLAKNRTRVAKEQHPFAIVLTCADSRVAPELIFDRGLGDLFTIRVAGNVTDPAIIGSIEYAAEHLKTPLIVVLGHENCGAVKAALSGEKLKGNLGQLIEHVHVGENLSKDKAEATVQGIKNNVLYQAETLESHSDVIKEFVHSKRLHIMTGVYSLSEGKVDWLERPKANGDKQK